MSQYLRWHLFLISFPWPKRSDLININSWNIEDNIHSVLSHFVRIAIMRSIENDTFLSRNTENFTQIHLWDMMLQSANRCVSSLASRPSSLSNGRGTLESRPARLSYGRGTLESSPATLSYGRCKPLKTAWQHQCFLSRLWERERDSPPLEHFPLSSPYPVHSS